MNKKRNLKKVVIPVLLLTVIGIISCITVEGINAKNEASRYQSEPIWISVNQEGYLPNEEKVFITNKTQASFEVWTSPEGDFVYAGNTVLLAEDDPGTGLSTYSGDFSSITEPGEYIILLDDMSRSQIFRIDPEIYSEIARESLRSFYFQRCGMELTDDLAGEFAHTACHHDPIVFHDEAVPEKAGSNLDAFGGWHDAGDYGKYTHSGSISSGVMLMAYERFPENYAYDDSGIPESGDGIPDLLNEVQYELEWLLTMQDDEDGGAYYMINTLNYEWEHPDTADDQQFVYGKSSVATADLTAVMAQAARIYNPFNPDFAETCLNAARKGWEFLQNHPELYPQEGHLRPGDTYTGGYASFPDINDRDERLWAGVELYLTTGDEEIHEIIKTDLKSSSDLNEDINWLDIAALPKLQYINGTGALRDSRIQLKLTQQLDNRCREITDIINKDGFHSSLKADEYEWGSNATILGRGMVLIIGYEETGKQEYRTAALRQLNYVLGINGNNKSYITEAGSNPPRNIHHVVFANDESPNSYPGVVTGGPNSAEGWGSRFQDDIMTSQLKEDTPPALCYLDHEDSYASNENCILYNMPLVFTAGYFIRTP